MNPFTIFLLGMLAGLAIAYAVMRLGFVIARRRLKTSGFDVGQSMSQFVRMCDVTDTFKEVAEALHRVAPRRMIRVAICKSCKCCYDASQSYKGHCGQACFYRGEDVAVARTPVPHEGT